MDNQFNNPYTRLIAGKNPNDLNATDLATEEMINTLAKARDIQLLSVRSKFGGAWDGFDKRDDLEGRMQNMQDLLNGNSDNDNSSSADLLGVTYPNTSFARQVEAAVTLAIHNPQTLYMAVGTPGLGGWDDHNNGVDRYPNRMNDLMEAIKAGMAHIRASNGVTTIGGGTRTNTDNIVINVFGDFGRLVNLNNSNGWDHANNQNLYTFGGAAVRSTKEAAALGTVVGTTIREGRSKTNNQYTMPDITGGSPTWEPMSVASSIYGYFGASNSEVMTRDEGSNPEGDRPFEDLL